MVGAEEGTLFLWSSDQAQQQNHLVKRVDGWGEEDESLWDRGEMGLWHWRAGGRAGEETGGHSLWFISSFQVKKWPIEADLVQEPGATHVD